MNYVRGGRPNLWRRFTYWFNSNEHVLMRYDPHRFYMNILYFVIIFLITIFLYKISPVLNNLNLLFLRVGSILLLVGVYFSIEYFYLFLRDFRKAYHNLKKGYKFLIAIAVIIVLVLVLMNQNVVFDKSKTFVESIDFYQFNLFSVPELIDNADVVSVEATSSVSDMRKFVTFLPLPSGYIIFWSILVGLILLLSVKFIFFGELPNWVILIIVILLVFMAFQYHVPYAATEVIGIGSCDQRGNLVFDFNPDTFNQPCVDFRSSICRPLCIDKKTVCQCEVTLYDFTFRRDGDYFS